MPPGGESPSISSPGAPRNRKVVWLRQHGIPAGRQRHCLPLLSVRCSLRLRRNAAGHTNKAARMPGPPPKGRTASRERPSPGRSLRFGGSDGNKWRRGGTIYEAVDGGGGSGALVRAVARIPGSPSTIERHTASPNAVSTKGERSGGTTLDFLLPRRINQFLSIRRRVLARQASSAVPKPALEGRESRAGFPPFHQPGSFPAPRLHAAGSPA